MSTTTAADASLINGVEFLDELERFEQLDERAADPGLDSRTYADAFDELESGLPMDPAARQTDAPRHERAPIDEPYEPLVDMPRPADQHIPFIAAALVLAACLTLGAATAALVFHDQLMQITAPRSATR
jgi:hypothetical protein